LSTSRTYTTGQVLTAAQQNDLEQGTLGYAQVTANQTGITTVVDLTGLTVTVTVVAGRRIRIMGSATFQNNTLDAIAEMTILEDATTIQTADITCRPASSNQLLDATVIRQPSVGSHTYKLKAAAGGGTVQMSASATAPAFILVEDIGI
jgi:hypothetical protein